MNPPPGYTGPENRRDRRLTLRAPIYVALGDEVVRKTIHVDARDVSAGGLSFETGRELPLDAETQLIVGGEGAGALTIRGRIVWTRLVPETGRYAVGVKFTGFDGLTRQELEARIAALASG